MGKVSIERPFRSFFILNYPIGVDDPLYVPSCKPTLKTLMDHLNDWFLAARQSGSLSCDVLRLLLFTTSSACKALCELGLEGEGAVMNRQAQIRGQLAKR